MQISKYSVPNFQPKAASKPSFSGSVVQELTYPKYKSCKKLDSIRPKCI